MIGASTCTFLCYEVGKGKISPAKARIAAMKFAKPKTKKGIRVFLGLTGYYRHFIDRYTARTVELTDALAGSKPDKIIWTEQMEQEFDLLKKALTKKPVLAAPDFDRTPIIQTDASIRGVGAILSQQFDDGERPIALFSKKLNPAQARYTAAEKECLAVILALQHFVVYLLGKRFILQTDHKALMKLRTMNNDNPRPQRWSISLQRFDFDITGSENTNVDGKTS